MTTSGFSLQSFNYLKFRLLFNPNKSLDSLYNFYPETYFSLCIYFMNISHLKFLIYCSSKSSVQLLSHVQLFATPWTAAHQASLYITNSWSSLKLTCIELVMPSSHLILCCPLLLLPQSLPASGSFPMSQFFAWGGQSIGVSASASVLPMNTQDWSPLGWTGWISLQSKDSQESPPTTQFKSINSLVLSFLHSELKWTGMAEFNSDGHYVYYCGQESLRRNGVAIMVNKRVQNAILGCNLKNDRMISVHFQDKPFSITVIQVYAPTSNAEEAEVEQFYEDLKELTTLKVSLTPN